jgi:hypothetical protein
MNLNYRVLRLEKIYRTRMDRGARDESAEHDRLTGDHLLRLWEGGADDWVRVRMEQVIQNCEGVTPEAKASLQERLKILQTGGPLEILSVITGLSRDCPEWSSGREKEVIEAALKVNPTVAKAVAEFGILRAGRKDWRAFAWWLERKFPQVYGRDRGPLENLDRPKVIGAKFSLWKPDGELTKEDSPSAGGSPPTGPLPTASTEDRPP